MKSLLIGCGGSRNRRFHIDGVKEWDQLVTLDNNKGHSPHIVWDLRDLPLPIKDNEYDEIHAYEVLEHIGTQGDYVTFFRQFSEFWRILKPGGHLAATCPSYRSMWAWGDPSHTRVITSGTLAFLSQAEYRKQVGVTPMSDFRHVYKADFEVRFTDETDEYLHFVIKAIK